ncbi:MAG TPA: hypothetical protein PKZ84_03845 [Anaerolineae bacterium]|nr:hypothetical protein [Anaerolineae bacterium]HQI83473.1 hypothetical protein [Anaerolineae bacterium]
MKSHTEARFWKFYDNLPQEIQRSADKAYKLWQTTPHHPSLQFKRVDPQEPIYSVRVGKKYRALGWLEDDTIVWFWIGSHAEYDALLKQR